MNYYQRGNILSNLPNVTKNLLIINVVVFAGTYIFQHFFHSNLPYWLALFSVESELFKPFQLITYMFMHGNLGHIFFNMFALFMFGRVLEQVYGGKRFFILYFASGIGAAFLHLLINYFQMQGMLDMANSFYTNTTPQAFWEFVQKFRFLFDQNDLYMADRWFNNPDSMNYAMQAKEAVSTAVQRYINIPTVGASGAVFGILTAFAIMFPNAELMLLFIPVPIKAKYLMPVYAVVELFFGVANFSWDNVAHFAHLGGAIVGFIVVRFWKKTQFRQY